MPECPNCGRDITESLDWSKEEQANTGGEGISIRVPCKCGKKFEAVYSYQGIWNPKNEEYIVRS